MPDEVEAVAVESYDLVETIPNLVHIIIDSTRASIAGSVRDYASLSFKKSPNTGWVIILGNDRIGGLLLSIFARLVNASFIYRHTVDEAVEFLASRDFTIKTFVEANPNLTQIDIASQE